MSYLLSYVNTRESTINYDRVFESTNRLMEFVRERHPDFTSAQIIVVRMQ